jgi:hypothetical protein
VKLKKPDRTVSNMAVLKDIRGLLSGTREQENTTASRTRSEEVLETEIARLETQIQSYKELVKKQQEELKNLKSPALKSAASGEEAAQLETRITELTSTLSQIDGLLKIKTQELLKRIARIFQEAGQGEVAIEFNKAASGLEVAENFARFVRVLLEQ